MFDRCSKMVNFIPLPRLRSILDTADIVSDWSPQFTSQVWHTFFQELEWALRCISARNPAYWRLHLPWVKYSYSSPSPHPQAFIRSCSPMGISCPYSFPRSKTSLFPLSIPISFLVMPVGNMPEMPCPAQPRATVNWWIDIGLCPRISCLFPHGQWPGV